METEAGDEGSLAGFRSIELVPISIARAIKRTHTYTTQVIFLADTKNKNACQSDLVIILKQEKLEALTALMLLGPGCHFGVARHCISIPIVVVFRSNDVRMRS